MNNKAGELESQIQGTLQRDCCGGWYIETDRGLREALAAVLEPMRGCRVHFVVARLPDGTRAVTVQSFRSEA